MQEKKLMAQKRELRGENGYKVFSIRVRDDMVNALDRLSKETNRSSNELINIMSDFAIQNCEIE